MWLSLIPPRRHTSQEPSRLSESRVKLKYQIKTWSTLPGNATAQAKPFPVTRGMKNTIFLSYSIVRLRLSIGPQGSSPNGLFVPGLVQRRLALFILSQHVSPWLTWWPRVPCPKDLRFVQRDVFAWAVKSHRLSNIRRNDGRLHYHEF